MHGTYYIKKNINNFIPLQTANDLHFSYRYSLHLTVKRIMLPLKRKFI